MPVFEIASSRMESGPHCSEIEYRAFGEIETAVSRSERLLAGRKGDQAMPQLWSIRAISRRFMIYRSAKCMGSSNKRGVTKPWESYFQNAYCK